MNALLSKLQYERDKALEKLNAANREWAVAEFGLDICDEQQRDEAIADLHRATAQIEAAARAYRYALEILQDTQCENSCTVYRTWSYFRRGFSLT